MTKKTDGELVAAAIHRLAEVIATLMDGGETEIEETNSHYLDGTPH